MGFEQIKASQNSKFSLRRERNSLTGHVFLIIGLFLLRSVAAQAASVTAASCSNSAVQAAINSVSSGDTVLIPGGSCAWSGNVTIPGTKGITLNGQGKTTITGGADLDITSNATIPTRVTGINFSGSYTNSTTLAVATHGCGGLSNCGGSVTAFVRIDHNTFNDPSDQAIFIASDGNGPTLIDSNTFTAGGAAEMIHNLGMGAGDASGWTDNVTPGSPYMYYVETNTFTYNASGNPAYSVGTSALQSYYGARTVFRDNTCNMCQIDQHGTPGAVWARWWEIYSNTFNTTVANATEGTYVTLRGGSGMVFDNVHVGNDGSTPNIDLQVECGSPGVQCTSSGSYPQQYQVGRGVAENISPAYIWNNTNKSDGSQIGVSAESALVQLNRDYYVSKSQPSTMLRHELTADTSSTTYSYTPFTYPFPLDSNGMPNPSGSSGTQPALNPPSNLTTKVQ